MEATKPTKPFGRKAYGSIPHLQGSRMGPGDYGIEAEQSDLLTLECRNAQRHVDRVTLTEKLDGSCVAVARLHGEILALIRAGYRAEDSPYAMHAGFARWVAARRARFLDGLADGERVPGEWLQVAHGTRYDIREDDDLFVGFDLIVPGRDRGKPEMRLPHDAQRERFDALSVRGAHVLSDGPAVPLDGALRLLGPRGHHGAIDEAEGVVYRLETNGACNFLAKFVRPSKLDGGYLDGIRPADGLGDILNGPAAERYSVPSPVPPDA